MDVHKYGLAPKGTSIVLYRNHEIRKVTKCFATQERKGNLEMEFFEACHSIYFFFYFSESKPFFLKKKLPWTDYP